MTARTPLTLSLEEESSRWCRQLAGTIIRLRRQRGWSQSALGDQVGLTQRQISQLETDPNAMHVGRLYGTLRALGVGLVVQPVAPADLALVRRRRSDRSPVNDQ